MRAKKFELWEEEIITEFFKSDGVEYLRKLLPHRTPDSLYSRAGKLGLREKRCPDWTLQEIDILRRCYPNMRLAQRKLPNRTFAAIQTKCHWLALAPVKLWKISEEQLVRKLSPTHSDVELARMLNRSAGAVERKRHLMGVYRRKTQHSTRSHLLGDLQAEADRRGASLRRITDTMGLPRLPRTRGEAQIRAVAKVVSMIGGDIYAEWDH